MPDNQEDTHSRAAINGHPIHPMLVPFPIAFLCATLATDLAFTSTADPFWARASIWMLAAALVTGALAAVAGVIDFASIKRARNRVGWTHAIGNVTAVGLSIVSLILRIAQPELVVTDAMLGLSLVVVAILVVTGWMGGELVFRHRIGQTNTAANPSFSAKARGVADRHAHPAE